MVLGGADTGKTTIIEGLINLLAKKTKIGVVDLDVGQSHIGPPTTLAWGLWEGEFTGWEAVEPLDIYFTGSTSPSGNLLPCLAGAKIIADQAKKAAHKVIIDTTGLIDEGGGRTLKEHKVEMIQPDLILALQKGDEMEHILCSFKGMKALKVIRLAVPREARQKTAPGRVNYREERFKKYFAAGKTIEVSWEEVGLRNTFIGRKEEPAGISILELEKYLGCEVVNIGKQGETLFVVYRGRYNKDGIEPVKSLYRLSSFLLRDVDHFMNRLVGLVDQAGRHRTLGIVENIDYGDGKMSIFSPIDPKVPIGCVIFGKHKITRDGYQIE